MSIVPLSSLLPPTTMADPGEAWELWQLDFSGGGNWEEQLVDLAHHLEQDVDGAKLGGVFSSVFGPIKVLVLIKFGIDQMYFKTRIYLPLEYISLLTQSLRPGWFYGSTNFWTTHLRCKRV